jgi:hypothetical protein
VTGVHRPWLSEVNGFQYGVVDFAIPWFLRRVDTATSSAVCLTTRRLSGRRTSQKLDWMVENH